MLYPGLAMVGVGFWWCQVTGFCCFCSCACLRTSDYLKCSLPSIYLIGACLSCNPDLVRTPQNPAFFVILWFWDPVMLRFWVCQSSWQSSFLWDPEILVWPSSWDPEILRSWMCESAWKWYLLWGVVGLSTEFETKVDQCQLEGIQASGWAGFLCPCSCWPQTEEMHE